MMMPSTAASSRARSSRLVCVSLTGGRLEFRKATFSSKAGAFLYVSSAIPRAGRNSALLRIGLGTSVSARKRDLDARCGNAAATPLITNSGRDQATKEGHESDNQENEKNSGRVRQLTASRCRIGPLH